MCTTFLVNGTLSNGRVWLGVSEQPFAQGKFSISSAGLSACSGNLLIFLFGCAAYGLLFKQTRALRSNSVFKAIAMLAKPAKICQRSARTSGEICTLIVEGDSSVQIGCSTLLAAPFVEQCTRQKKRVSKYTSNLYRLRKQRSLRQEQSISGAEKARKSTCLGDGIPPGRVWS